MEEECNHLYQAWHNVETVVKELPFSETRELLLLGFHYFIEGLKSPTVNRFFILMITHQINEVVRNSPIDLGIEDVLTQANLAVALVCHVPEEYVLV
jgi:hypothetical protein